MASSTECPLFPKPQKGKDQSQKDNKKRNKITKANAALITSGLSFAQALHGKILNRGQHEAMTPRRPTLIKITKTIVLTWKKLMLPIISIMNNSFFGISIFSWNVDGVRSRIVEIRDFIDKHSPDLLLIQETHLRLEYSFSIPNYICYRNDRTNSARGWGGTAILIKRYISHFHVPTPPLLTGVEATLVALTPSDQEPFLVASIYAPPNPTYRNLGADFNAIFKIFKSAFSAGDFNAKRTSWGCVNSDPRGNYLLRYITNNNLGLIAPPTPTRYGSDSASPLDYALIKNFNWPCTADSIPELSSDHNPSIFTKILAHPENFELPTSNSTYEIDSQVSNLTSEILNAHASASRPFYHSEQPYVQGELKELIKERNKARKTWQQTRHPQNRSELNRLQNIIKRKIYHYRQQAWEDNLSTLIADVNSLWGIAKAFSKKTSPISALNGPTGIALSDTNKSAHSLESIST
ncbi:probable RNA-directed DNA polymerase from transposon X-element [Trichonephila clavipes]|nr:probable RNA-directed DNA polymerase from transposon X-element [Trichonephila clavipes]